MSKTAQAPDYTAAAEKQGESSAQVTNMQTWANRPDINTPFGSQTWSPSSQIDPATGQKVTKWQQDTTLNPESQAALDAQMAIQQGRSELAGGKLGQINQEFSGGPDWNSFQALQGSPEVPTYQGAPGATNYASAPGASNFQGVGPSTGVQRTLDRSGMPTVDPSSKYYTNAGDAIYGQWSNRNEPRFAQDTEALRTKLYNQGLREGDKAYNTEVQRQTQDQGDARTQASLAATAGAGSEAARMFGMDLGANQNEFGQRTGVGNFTNSAQGQEFGQNVTGAGVNNSNANNVFQQLMAGTNLNNTNATQNYNQDLTGTNTANSNMNMAFGQGQSAANMNNQLRQQQIAEMLQKRGFSLNEMNAILNGQQVGMPNMPAFNTASKSDTVQYLDAAKAQYSAAQDAANAQNSMTQGLMSGASMFMSDRRLKSNIKQIGKWHGHNLYVYDIFGNTQVGVMADEVAHIPGVVVRHSSGYDMVNYGKL